MAQRRADVIWRELDGRVVGLDLASSRYFSLNGAAALLWRSLADDVEREHLAELLTAEYGIDVSLARQDVAAFLAQLEEGGLLAG